MARFWSTIIVFIYLTVVIIILPLTENSIYYISSKLAGVGVDVGVVIIGRSMLYLHPHPHTHPSSRKKKMT